MNMNIYYVCFRFYFFGCLSVTTDEDFKLQKAKEGTWIKGYTGGRKQYLDKYINDEEWLQTWRDECKSDF